MPILLPLQMPSVPEGFCNTLGADWVQQILNAIAAGGVAVLDSGATQGTIILNQEATPNPDQRNYLWRIPGWSTNPLHGIIFEYNGGAWIAPHPIPPASLVRQWFEGDATDLDTYDGGSAGAVGDNSGPMWAIDPNYAGRSPMGAGAIPGSDPAKTLAVGENYGEGSHVLTVDELATHHHAITVLSTDNVTNSPNGDHLRQDTTNPTTFNTDDTGSSTAHQNVHPVRGGNWIVRTIRKNYVAA